MCKHYPIRVCLDGMNRPGMQLASSVVYIHFMMKQKINKLVLSHTIFRKLE